MLKQINTQELDVEVIEKLFRNLNSAACENEADCPKCHLKHKLTNITNILNDPRTFLDLITGNVDPATLFIVGMLIAFQYMEVKELETLNALKD